MKITRLLLRKQRKSQILPDHFQDLQTMNNNQYITDNYNRNTQEKTAKARPTLPPRPHALAKSTADLHAALESEEESYRKPLPMPPSRATFSGVGTPFTRSMVDLNSMGSYNKPIPATPTKSSKPPANTPPAVPARSNEILLALLTKRVHTSYIKPFAGARKAKPSA